MFWIPSQLEGAYVGQDVTIECHSEAFPDSINYWIKKDGVMLLLSKLSDYSGFLKCSNTGFIVYKSISPCIINSYSFFVHKAYFLRMVLD